MFSKSCEKAIRAIVYISSENNVNKKVGLHEICQNSGSPEPYTAKILQTLVRKECVSSQKGLHGGVFLDKIQLKLPLIEIVTAIDENHLFEGCVLGLKQCNELFPCPLHNQFKVIRANIREVMENITFEELGKMVRSGNSVFKNLNLSLENKTRN